MKVSSNSRQNISFYIHKNEDHNTIPSKNRPTLYPRAASPERVEQVWREWGACYNPAHESAIICETS